MYFLNDIELEKKHGLSKTEAKLFRKAVDNGKNNRKSNQKYGKKLKNYVGASGSITSSEMKYTQTVVDFSVESTPQYLVLLSYEWSFPYLLGIFDDEIVAAWGGGLNTRSETGHAEYFCYSSYLWHPSYLGDETMEIEVSPNQGIEFSFPQTSGEGKTKRGIASFTLYQTKERGFDTKLVSQYCHRVFSIQSADISITSTEVGASISITTAWDATAQKRATIGYK